MSADTPPGGRPKLGRGLAALLGEDAVETQAGGAETPSGRAARSIPLTALAPGAAQPRRHFDEDALDALAQSIREKGMLQPIIARRVPDEPGRYEIVAGERRWRAAQKAGLAEAPVIVKDLGERDALEIALVENIQREDLNPIEEAGGYQRLIDAFGYTQDDLAKAVGKSRPHIANTLRLLSAPKTVITRLEAGELSAGHVRALLVSPNAESLAETVVSRGLNVRQTEKLVQEGGPPAQRQAAPLDPNVTAVEKDLANALGLKVGLKPKGKRGGRLVLEYTDLNQLDLLIQRLTGRTPAAAADHALDAASPNDAPAADRGYLGEPAAETDSDAY